MTKQEEIRDRVIANIAKACSEMLNADIVKLADKILQGEASQGVVVRVDRELPFPGERMFARLNYQVDPMSPIRGSIIEAYRLAEQDILEAGCGFFEPLIKDDK